MKILIIHNSYHHKGGEDQVILAEQNILSLNGNVIDMFQVENSINSPRDKLSAAINVHKSNTGKAMVAKRIGEFSPDVVHVHNFFPLLTPSIYDACIDACVPVVQTLHNYRTICPGALLMRDSEVCEKCIIGSPYNAVKYKCYRNSRAGSWAVARMVNYHRKKNTWNTKVNRFIALTEFAKGKFMEAGFLAEKISVKPNFCSLEIMSDVIQNRSGALFVGRISEEKGINTLLRAWERLVIPLSVAGDGPLIDYLTSNDLANVTILGRKRPDEITKEMQNSEFLVMPSEWYEGFPMVLVEAFSNALPVICSRLGGMAEVVEDGKTGLHFEAGNADDLVEKVRWAELHPKEMRVMGERAKKVYEKKYNPEVNYQQLMAIYEEAIADSKRKNSHA